MTATPPYPVDFFAEDAVPFDVAVEVAAGYDIEYRQLEPGRNTADLKQLRIGSFELAYERFERRVAVHATRPDGARPFGLTAVRDHPLKHRGRDMPPDTLMFVRPDVDADVQFLSLCTFVVEPRALAAYLTPRGLDVSLRHDEVQ